MTVDSMSVSYTRFWLRTDLWPCLFLNNFDWKNNKLVIKTTLRDHNKTKACVPLPSSLHSGQRVCDLVNPWWLINLPSQQCYCMFLLSTDSVIIRLIPATSNQTTVFSTTEITHQSPEEYYQKCVINLTRRPDLRTPQSEFGRSKCRMFRHVQFHIYDLMSVTLV